MKIKLGVVVGGVAAVAVLAFGLTQLNLGKGGQGRISLRQDVAVSDTRDTRDFGARGESSRDSVRSNYVAPSVQPVTTVTAESLGLSSETLGVFKLAVCAPSDLTKVNLTYRAIGGKSAGQVYSDVSTGGDFSLYNGLIPKYTAVNDTTPNKKIEIDEFSAFFVSKDENSSSCTGGVEWKINVDNFESIEQFVQVPHFAGHVVVYVDAFGTNGGKLGETVIVSQDVPVPVGAVLN